MGAGFPINSQVSPDSPIYTHPLYVKYSTQTIQYAVANVADLKSEVLAILPNEDTSDILAYLSNLIRITALMA